MIRDATTARDVRAVVFALFGVNPYPLAHLPMPIVLCTAPKAARRFCENLLFAENCGGKWLCTMAPGAPMPADVNHEGIGDGRVCTFPRDGKRPGVSAKVRQDRPRLDAFTPRSVTLVDKAVWDLAPEDSPDGRAAQAITRDFPSLMDRDLDVGWLHTKPRMTDDERVNRWREEAQERLCERIAEHVKDELNRKDGPCANTPAKPNGTAPSVEATKPASPPTDTGSRTPCASQTR